MVSNAQAYSGKFFEGYSEIFDRPYAAGSTSVAYACITFNGVRKSVSTSINSSGDQITSVTTYQTSVPVLYEFDGAKWYWVSKTGIINQNGK
jgi:hypothetical protein